MKHFGTSIILFPVLFASYGFAFLPMLLQTPEFSPMSLFSFFLESLYQLVLGYLICIPVSLILSSLIFKKRGNLWAILSYISIISCLYVLSHDMLSEILVTLLPIITIVHYHSYDLQEFFRSRKRIRIDFQQKDDPDKGSV